MAKNKPIYDVSYRERQFNRVLVAIRQEQVFLNPPLATFMFGQKPWSLRPTELAVLSLLSEYGKPVVAEELRMSVDAVDDYIAIIYKKLETTKELTIGSRN
jgi:DNA-binding NarL/FixJ family response regulator